MSDMTARNLDKANELFTIGMKNIKVLLTLLGTDFAVMRSKTNSKYKNVFGGAYSSESSLENDYEQFTARLIINQNELRDVWNRNRDTLEAYTNDNTLQIGDELEYIRKDRVYRFKISQKLAYSEAAEAFYVYTLSSIVETLNM